MKDEKETMMNDPREKFCLGIAVAMMGVLLLVCIGNMFRRPAASDAIVATPSAMIEHIVEVDSADNKIVDLADQP